MFIQAPQSTIQPAESWYILDVSGFYGDPQTIWGFLKMGVPPELDGL